jgi:transcriptional regulator with XRE-family HTH domain
MTIKINLRNLRAKKLGVLIKDARLFRGKTSQDCANILDISNEVFLKLETGVTPPSLPQIEALALFLDIPLDYFWGNEVISAKESIRRGLDINKSVSLRQRVIGASLRQNRIEAGLSSEELVEKIGISTKTLDSYELGDQPIPLPVLEDIASQLDRSIQSFFPSSGPIASWVSQKQASIQFSELPTEMQMFISKPSNRPYLGLAQRLSEMSVEKLRSVAEGLLEITL